VKRTLRLSTTPQAAESAADAVEHETDHVSMQREAALQQPPPLPPPQTDADNHNRRLERQQHWRSLAKLKAQLKKQQLLEQQRLRQEKAKGQMCSGLSPPGPSAHDVDGSADPIMSKGALL